MFDESVIVGSGQTWKALTAVSGSIAGAGLMLGGLVLLRGDHRLFAIYVTLLGIGTFGASAVFASCFIRCPHCGARWVWLAMRRADAAGWVAAIVAPRVCSVCGR